MRSAGLADELYFASLVHRAVLMHTERALAAEAGKGKGPRLDDGGRLYFDGVVERSADFEHRELLAGLD